MCFKPIRKRSIFKDPGGTVPLRFGWLYREPSLKGTPPLFDVSQNSATGRPIELKFLPDIDNQNSLDTCSRKKNFSRSSRFFSKNLLYQSPSLCPGKLQKISSVRVENFFGGSHIYSPEVIFTVFENIVYFFFYNENTEKISADPLIITQKPYKSGSDCQK